MNATEKRETVQTFEFTKKEVIEIITGYLRVKEITVPPKAVYTFEFKVNPTSRELEWMRMKTETVEEGPATVNGK
jgi:hypothetical protein